MIGYLTGKIISKKPTKVLIDVNGIGYIVNISINTFDKISEPGEQISLHTYLSVKEDSLTLFGFYSISEKELFEVLISVNGVGPKLAQAVLSGITADEFKNAINHNNVSRLVAIPGVGKKTAERMMIELRDKIEKVSDSNTPIDSKSITVKDDAVMALIGLGYNQKVAEKVTRSILDENSVLTLEELIKESLRRLNN
ncbi:MAG: Holliday junction branch migration protein RuvA [Ignavibacteriae bacterium]|nr:Holliday junction branch migration protein RuvA [Ignavibacteriota bacterium]MCB9208171.1 Holliday junction branch migration protein RuvA [Ignavibacteriales bacterium]MCB9258937.1 Holliday junction branch migration protein RuvA [Ignavibacteriales bacterium]